MVVVVPPFLVGKRNSQECCNKESEKVASFGLDKHDASRPIL